MEDRRNAPDPRSPVQPARAGRWPVILVIVAAIVILWTLRDTWVDPFEPPYPPAKHDSGSAGGAHAAQGNLASLFSGDDYPMEALRNEEQGTVGVELRVDERGRISGCEVESSSGSQSLDKATCSILQRRARFSPARDNLGRPVSDTYRQRITWRLED